MSTERPRWVDSQLFPFEDKWISLSGHTIHYVDEGPRDGPVLLLVHPGAGWGFTYRYQIYHLRKDFRCIAPDLPGYGLSTAADGYTFTLLEQSRALEQFVEALDLKDIIAWCNDASGPTVVLALGGNPERVRGLVVAGTFGWSLKEYPMVGRFVRLVSGPIPRFVNRYTNFFAWAMGTKRGIGSRSLSKLERRHYTRPFRDKRARNRALRLLATFNDPATQEALDSALPSFRNKSVLIQFGEKDPAAAMGWPERWAHEIPNSRTYVIPNVAHFAFEGDPEATVNNFRAWWKTFQPQSGEGRRTKNSSQATPVGSMSGN